MSSKKERFKLWRGTKYAAEKSYLRNAELINAYVNTVENLQTIVNDFKGHPSEKYKEFNKDKKLTFGMIVYAKLQIDEAIETLDPKSEESRILNDLKITFENSYDNPKRNAKNNVDKLFDLISKLIDLYPDKTDNKNQARALCFSLYTLLIMINGFLNNMNGAVAFIARQLIALDDTKEKITRLMIEAEQKVEQLDRLLVDPAEKSSLSTEYQTAQEYFNKQFLDMLKVKGASEDEKLDAVLENMKEVHNNLSNLIDNRNKQMTIKSNIKTVKDLVKAANLNDTQIRSRKYALSLVDEYKSNLDVVLRNTYSMKKNIFVSSLHQLQTPGLVQNLTSNLLYAVSWSSSILTIPYRYIMPQTVQDVVAVSVPATLDSQCKTSLKELSRESLSNMEKKLAEVNGRIDTAQSNLFNNNKQLISLVKDESIEQLTALLQANKEAQGAVIKYRELSRSIREKSQLLLELRNKDKTIDVFIQKNDGLLVVLSNFFARLSSLFKTETAELIDSSRALKIDIERCIEQVNKECQQIKDQGMSLNNGLKEILTQGLSDAEKLEKPERTSNPSKEDIRLMIKQKDRFFPPAGHEHNKDVDASPLLLPPKTKIV